MQFSHVQDRNRALTLIEVIVVIAVLAILVGIFVPDGSTAKKYSRRISCVNNLKEDVLALKIWGEDHNDHWPQFLSNTNGGARELLGAGNVAAYFEIMSNELSMSKILACPADEEHPAVLSFLVLANTNISYLVSVNADESDPKAAVFADDNFAVDEIPVKPGVQNLWTNRSVAWTAKLHHFAGNIALADGSVWQFNNAGLTNLLAEPGAATNLVVIP